jgi:hypothetical protein
VKQYSLLFILLLSAFYKSFSQEYIWIDKNILDSHPQKNIKIRYCSEWLTQCSVESSEEVIYWLESKNYPYKHVAKFTQKKLTPATRPILGFALEQINANYIIDEGLTGNNVKIGIIDGGFLNAQKSPNLKHVFDKNKVRWYKDYITPDMEEYGGTAYLDDAHGTEVFYLIAGKHSTKDILYGLAPNATFYLARTDHGAFEKRLEEDYLILALEELQKKGVRIVNISLGYATGYADPSENYVPSQMDGKTTMIARAIDTAFFSKNMLPIVAAGNDGDIPRWQVVSTPGDAKGALTVGATKLKIWEKLDYSSVGMEGLEFVKPEVSCFATQGTSFSTPIITGLAATMLEYDSSLTSAELKEMIIRSSHLYPFQNNYIGYGVPDCEKIMNLLKKKPISSLQGKKTKRSSYKIRLEKEKNYVVVYHKKDQIVKSVEIIRPESNSFKIKKPATPSNQTTVLYDDQAIEIIWN